MVDTKHHCVAKSMQGYIPGNNLFRVFLSTLDWFFSHVSQITVLHSPCSTSPRKPLLVVPAHREKAYLGSSQRLDHYQHSGFQGDLPGLKHSLVVNPASQWFGSQTMVSYHQEVSLGPTCYSEAQRKGPIPKKRGGKNKTRQWEPKQKCIPGHRCSWGWRELHFIE